ncbi:MAG TPA: zf-HC2 domain-containing protein [Segeticoccus sp.]|uniref:zf-HC2 domain-containing protein n=1 Tax=Segeticoccus sp. TaxID=2706531 RepID=UPI002D80BCC7|nr:zf-HC2 domain-containing protein [Segeticoccus sp.]HET8599893.1 zf-HC2 domain-containing protein [Segeticoccus sp.]
MPALPGGDGNHLGDLVSAYADRRLPADLQLAADRHVVVCDRCRQAAAEETELLAALRCDSVPTMSAGLAASLMGLGQQERPQSLPGPAPVATVSLGAPALHRSVRHAVAAAAVAASVCGMAAWAIAGPGPSAHPVQPRFAQPSSLRPGGEARPALPAAWHAARVPVTAVLVDQQGVMRFGRPGPAQSTP